MSNLSLFRYAGRKKISLFCSWERHPANEMLTPIRAHILFKGTTPGDLYFMQLEECKSLLAFDVYY
jgi:hypothetical protein